MGQGRNPEPPEVGDEILLGKTGGRGSVASFPGGRLWRLRSLGDDSGRNHAGETMLSVKGAHFPQEMILTCGRW